MTIEELKSHPLFHSLNPRLQVFLVRYLETEGDTDLAVKEAYQTTTVTMTRILGKRALNSPVVSRLIAIWHGEVEDVPTQRSYLAFLWECIHEEKGTCRAGLLDLFADISGWKRTRVASPSTDPESVLGQLQDK